LLLGLATNEYQLSFDGANSSLGARGSVLDDRTIGEARKVVFRRWKVSPPTSIVAAAGDSATDIFLVREWEDSIDLLLSRWFSLDPMKWSRDPLMHSNKQVLLSQVADLVPIPSFELSTSPSRRLVAAVTKPVNTNQHFKEGLRASTIAVSSQSTIFDRVQACPTLLQDRIDIAHELRLSYSFGEVATVEQRFPPDAPVDHRYALDCSRVAGVTSAETERAARSISTRLGLRVFTADILVDSSGDHWWVDINPDGLHLAADSLEEHLVGSFARGLN
jgi:hypothetical protein